MLELTAFTRSPYAIYRKILLLFAYCYTPQVFVICVSFVLRRILLHALKNLLFLLQ